MLTVVRPNGEKTMVSWLNMPCPYFVVKKVMRDYRREQSYLECIKSAFLADNGVGISREARLLYVGMVAKVLSTLDGISGKVIEQMHPPEDVQMSMTDIAKSVGVNVHKVQSVYDLSVMVVAPEMFRKELFINFREELVG